MAVLLSDSFARTDQPLFLSYADTGQQWNCDPTSSYYWGVEGGKLTSATNSSSWAAIPRNSAARYFRCAVGGLSSSAAVLYIYPWSPDGTDGGDQTRVRIQFSSTMGVYAQLIPAHMSPYTTETGVPHTAGQSHIIEIWISTSDELVVAIDDTVLGLVHMTQAAIDSTFNGQYLVITHPYPDWIDDVLMTDQAIPGGGGGSPDDPGDGSGGGAGVGTWIITGSVDW